MLLAAFPAAAEDEDAQATSASAPIARPAPKPAHPAPKPARPEAKLDPAQARQLYYLRKQRLEQIRSQQDEVARDQRTLTTNRARMHARLVETAKALTLSEKRLTEIEERLAQMRARIKDEREKFEDKATQMSALFMLLQGMSKRPPPVMFTHSKDALRMIRSGMILAAFYADVEKLAKQISSEVDRLDAAERDAQQQELRRKTEQSQNAKLKSQIDLLLIENGEQIEIAQETLENLKTASEINLAGLQEPGRDSSRARCRGEEGPGRDSGERRPRHPDCVAAACRYGGEYRLREFAGASANARAR